MKIAVIQTDIVWADPAANLQKADIAIASNPCADLYLLPEMFSTGFCTEPEGIAESECGIALQWMKWRASEIDAAIAGSVAVHENGRYCNRFYFVKPDGTITYYDKKHLFSYGGENLRFTPGNERVVEEFRGVRFLLEVCYDLRFPVWARNRGDYDMILYVASWPVPRISAWSTLLLARAIENQCYVAGVNRIGTDPTCEYCGASVVINPYGKQIASCPDNTEHVAFAEIDMEELNAFRQKFPALDDADSFQLV